MKHKPIFVTGIGTGVGKTITSAIIVEHLNADYWKPVQAGDLHFTDTDKVKSLISNNSTIFHPEAYRLTQPFSPHKSAMLDDLRIDMTCINLPDTTNRLIIEGAGGLLVPLNDQHLMIDLIKKFDAEVVLVSQNYLGSINHTLMSAEILRNRGIVFKNLIISGEPNESSEDIISKITGLKIINILFLTQLDRAEVKEAASRLNLY